MDPARECMVKAEEFLEFKQMTYEIDSKSTVFEFLKKKFQCDLERLSVATAFAVGLLMKPDGSDPADMTATVTDVISLIINMPNAEQEKI